jgi:four helix bundle protein
MQRKPVISMKFSKLDVYRVAIQLNVLIDKVVEDLPRGRSYLADQLQRAGSSIPLNIAEGAG